MLNIEFIRDTIYKLLGECNISLDSLLGDNGNYIYYRNGNDGTDFDFSANDMSCEFMCFYKSSKFGAIKANAISSGYLRFYIYDEKDWSKVIREGKIELPCDFQDLCEHLYGTFDLNDIWDEVIPEWTLSDCASLYDEEEDEEDDWEEDE